MAYCWCIPFLTLHVSSRSSPSRRQEEVERYRMEQQQHPKLRMNSQFNYSSMAAARGSTA